MPATAQFVRSNPRKTLVIAADVVLGVLITAGYLIPKLTQNPYYWPLVVLASCILIPSGYLEYNLIIARARLVHRPWPLVGRALAAAIVPAIGAVVLCYIVICVAAGFGIVRADSDGPIYLAIFCALGVFGLAVLTGADDRLPARRRALGHCPHCGYDLRAQYGAFALSHPDVRTPHAAVSDRADSKVTCPECGLSPDDLFASATTER